MATTMTRMHFQLIADVLDEAISYADDRARAFPESIGWEHHRQELRVLADVFAERLAMTNPNFNLERFLTAAGVR